MAQFDVYRNPGNRTGKQAPYLVAVQGRFVEALSTCVVMPLVCREYFDGASILNPLLPVNGIEYIISPAEITSVRREILLQTPMCQLSTRDRFNNYANITVKGKMNYADNCKILWNSDQNVLQGTWSPPFSRHLWGIQRSI